MRQLFVNFIFLYFVFLKSEARPLPPPSTGVTGKNYYSNQPGELNTIPLTVMIQCEFRNFFRSIECRLGDKIHELGSTWYAGTGPSSSVNYCIKCECVPVSENQMDSMVWQVPDLFCLFDQVIKRSRLLAKVDCRDIKTECPKLDCDDAIQLPGKCCNVCQGHMNGKKN